MSGLVDPGLCYCVAPSVSSSQIRDILVLTDEYLNSIARKKSPLYPSGLADVVEFQGHSKREGREFCDE